MAAEPIVFRPKPGMQEEFLARSEFEVLFGGQAGAGSSWALLFEPALFKWIDLPYFVAIYFRRESPQLGDLISQAMEIYVPLGGRFIGQDPIYRRQAFIFPSGAKILFSHMQTLTDMQNIHGHQYHRAYVNEVTRFPEVMYLYIISRIRGKDPDFPYGIRCDANPEDDNEGYLWVYDRFIQKLGHQALKPRYFTRVGDRDVEVSKGAPGAISRVFVPKFRRENDSLDKNYESRLRLLPERLQNALLRGVWELTSRPNQVIKSEWWARAISGEIAYNDSPSKDWGADFAHEGADKSVLYFGFGNQPRRRKSWPQTKATEYGRIIADEMRDEGYHNCWAAVDCNGPGAGVGDTLSEDAKVAERFERCIEKDYAFDAWAKQRYAGRIQFNNWRSQAWWKFREDMENGEIDLSYMAKGPGYFDDWNRLQQEILIHTFKVENGKVVVISKKELRKADSLGRSPDDADALVLWNWGRGKGLLGSTKAVDMNADYGLQKLYQRNDTPDEAEAWA